MSQVDQILNFWFGETRDQYNTSLWWHKTYRHKALVIEDVDQYIKEQWGFLLEQDLGSLWWDSNDGIMALILLYDQFPRHVYRGTDKSFAFDEYACSLAQQLLNVPNLPIPYQMFCHVALMHSENVDIVSKTALELFKLANLENLDSTWRSGLQKTARVCNGHVKVLEKFHRYPHRNAILGRLSTPDELTFMSSDKIPYWMKSVLVDSHANKSKVKLDPVPEKLPGTEVKTKLKILVLHSNKQSARTFKSRTEKYLGKKLHNVADLTYANAPHPYEPSGEIKHIIQDNEYSQVPGSNLNSRVWWNASDDPQTMIYHGLGTSLEFINSLFANDQFDGIIGFSQGGTLAGIIAGLLHDQKTQRISNIVKSLKFIVCISGFYCRDTREEFRHCTLQEIPDAHLPDQVKVRTNLINLPSFHVWGSEDTLVNPWRSQKLAEAFYQSQIHIHPSSHFARAIKHWPIDTLVKWLNQFTTSSPFIGLDYTDAVQLYESLSKTYTDPQIYDLLIAKCRENSLVWSQLIKLDTIQTTPKFRMILTVAIGNVLKQEYIKYYVEQSLGIPSKLVSYAPKYNTTYKSSRLFYDVANYLASIMNIFDSTQTQIKENHPKKQILLSYNQYKKVISRLLPLLSSPVPKPEPGAHIPRLSLEEMLKTPISDLIKYPRAEPVDISPLNLLQPLYTFLQTQAYDETQHVFEKGTICADKRLDLCKQVIGPRGIEGLIKALKIDSSLSAPKVKHLLLGNNICGNELGTAIGQFIQSGKSALTTWYIAGNKLDHHGIEPICDALCQDQQVEQLWLKRNPLHAQGIPPILKMLSCNKSLKVLDLTNTGLMDEGAMLLFNHSLSALEYLYLSSNGLTEQTCEVIKDRRLSIKLKGLALGCNRLGHKGAKYLSEFLGDPKCQLQSLEIASCAINVDGAKHIAEALKHNTSLVTLNFGFLKSTNDLAEIPNFIASQGAVTFAEMLTINHSLRSLDMVYTGIQQDGLDALTTSLSDQNNTLLYLKIEQFGIAHNENTREIVRKSLQRNKDILSPGDLDRINMMIYPQHLEQIKSVYRVQQNI